MTEMRPVQRVPVIEEVMLTDSEDEVAIRGSHDSQTDDNFFNRGNDGLIQNTIEKPKKNIPFSVEKVHLQEDNINFSMPSAIIGKKMKTTEANYISNDTRYTSLIARDSHEKFCNVMDWDDDNWFYINEDCVTSTAINNETDLSAIREDERLSSLSTSIMGLKSDNEKRNSVPSGVGISKELSNISKSEEDNLDYDVLKDDGESEITAADNESNTTLRRNSQGIVTPSPSVLQFGKHIKFYIETICNRCHAQRRLSGKLKQNKSCRKCKADVAFQCVKCKKLSNSYPMLLNHLKRECLAQKIWKCSQCEFSATNAKKVEEHGEKEHGLNFRDNDYNVMLICKGDNERTQCLKRKVHRCNMCDYSSTCKIFLQKHVVKIHQDMSSICVPEITSSLNVSNKINRKSAEEIRKKEEERLNKSISLRCSKCMINSEYTGVHGKKCANCAAPFLWQCTQCSEISKSYCGIFEHVLNSCDGIKCDKCNKYFSSPENLEKHQYICGQDLLLQCELCDFTTKLSSRFLQHVKRRHGLEGVELRKWL